MFHFQTHRGHGRVLSTAARPHQNHCRVQGMPFTGQLSKTFGCFFHIARFIEPLPV